MSQTLLVLALGPVQDFIERARRMRDLWFGSHILSELSRAAAKRLAEEPGWTLVFPALDLGDVELDPCLGMRRADGNPPLGIVNKVLALGPATDDAAVELLAAAARGKAIDVWKDFARQAAGRAKDLIARDLRPEETPEGVIESLIEVYASWTSVVAPGDFERARQDAEEALAARKRLRDFSRWPCGGPYPKSSLDGCRESILVDRAMRPRVERPRKSAGDLRLDEREHLDGVAFVKRAGGEPDQFVPVARVAVEPWLAAVQRAAVASPAVGQTLANLEKACRERRVARCSADAAAWLRGGFVFDGELFFEGQWQNIELSGEGDAPTAFCRRFVGPLFTRHRFPAPSPYLACLSADGDSMGAALSTLGSADEHRAVSRALAEFARGVRAIVEGHAGVQIYAGGDDVLAFVPVDSAVQCADDLRRAFHRTLATAFPGQDAAPTLSVGLAIGHTLTPLGELVGRARDALHLAKDGDDLPPGDPRRRNALGVISDKRSGGETAWRCQWTAPDDGSRPVQQLEALRDLMLDGRMPRRLPYELREVRERMHGLSDEDRVLGPAFRHEVERVIARKRPDASMPKGAPKPDAKAFGLELPAPNDSGAGKVRDALDEWVRRAEVAMILADARRNIRAVARALQRSAAEAVQ